MRLRDFLKANNTQFLMVYDRDDKSQRMIMNNLLYLSVENIIINKGVRKVKNLIRELYLTAQYLSQSRPI